MNQWLKALAAFPEELSSVSNSYRPFTYNSGPTGSHTFCWSSYVTAMQLRHRHTCRVNICIQTYNVIWSFSPRISSLIPSHSSWTFPSQHVPLSCTLDRPLLPSYTPYLLLSVSFVCLFMGWFANSCVTPCTGSLLALDSSHLNICAANVRTLEFLHGLN